MPGRAAFTIAGPGLRRESRRRAMMPAFRRLQCQLCRRHKPRARLSHAASTSRFQHASAGASSKPLGHDGAAGASGDLAPPSCSAIGLRRGAACRGCQEEASLPSSSIDGPTTPLASSRRPPWRLRAKSHIFTSLWASRRHRHDCCTASVSPSRFRDFA